MFALAVGLAASSCASEASEPASDEFETAPTATAATAATADAGQAADSGTESELLSPESQGQPSATTNAQDNRTDTELDEEPTAKPIELPDDAILMPDLMCFDLQDAQDFMQEFTGDFFAVNSKDASGEYRLQLFDRNWIVVDQEPLPGEPLVDTPTVLVLKDDETSDC